MSLFSNFNQDFDMIDKTLRLTLFKTIKEEYIKKNYDDLININKNVLIAYSIVRELNELKNPNDPTSNADPNQDDITEINMHKKKYIENADKIKKLIFSKNKNVLIDLIKLNFYRFSIYKNMTDPNDYLNSFKNTEYYQFINTIPKKKEIKLIIKKWKILLRNM